MEFSRILPDITPTQRALALGVSVTAVALLAVTGAGSSDTDQPLPTSHYRFSAFEGTFLASAAVDGRITALEQSNINSGNLETGSFLPGQKAFFDCMDNGGPSAFSQVNGTSAPEDWRWLRVYNGAPQADGLQLPEMVPVGTVDNGKRLASLLPSCFLLDRGEKDGTISVSPGPLPVTAS
jgi:hypothetical protein